MGSLFFLFVSAIKKKYVYTPRKRVEPLRHVHTGDFNDVQNNNNTICLYEKFK